MHAQAAGGRSSILTRGNLFTPHQLWKNIATAAHSRNQKDRRIMAFSQCADCRDKDGASYSKPGFSIPGLEPPPSIWIHDLTQAACTGDVVLFSSKHSASNITKFFTNSLWDHVGVVVKPTPRRAYLVEWGGGLFATELVERLSEYDKYDAREIKWRHLKLSTAHREQLEDQLEDFLDMLFLEQLGRNTTVPFGQVARAARRQWFPTPKTDDGAPFADDLATLFCSKLVAVSYKSIGVLHASRDASSFLPKHFAERDAAFLDLQGEAALGPETTVTFEAEMLRNAVDALVHPFAATLDLVAGAATGTAAPPRPTPELYVKVLGPLGRPVADGIDHLSGASAHKEAATRLQTATRRVLACNERERRRLMLAAAEAAATATPTGGGGEREEAPPTGGGGGGGTEAREDPPESRDAPAGRTKGSERRARLEAMSATKAPRADGMLLDEHGAGQLAEALTEEWNPHAQGGTCAPPSQADVAAALAEQECRM